MNGITTILPLRLESRICLPDGSTKVNSGDLRGTGGVAKAETVSATNDVAAKAHSKVSHTISLPQSFYGLDGRPSEPNREAAGIAGAGYFCCASRRHVHILP